MYLNIIRGKSISLFKMICIYLFVEADYILDTRWKSYFDEIISKWAYFLNLDKQFWRYSNISASKKGSF